MTQNTRHFCAAVLLSILVAHSAAYNDGRLDVVYPEPMAVQPGQRHPQNKTPLQVLQKCAENEIAYPADHHDDYVCDCKPGYLYDPGTRRCHAAQRQGPCARDHVLVLTPGSHVPVCLRNPCRQGDGYVLLNTGCFRLGTAGPCTQPELGFRVAIDVTTLKPACVSEREQLQGVLPKRND